MSLIVRRRQFAAVALLATAGGAEAAPKIDDGAMIGFDTVYIPSLFLTGAAPKSPQGPERAQAALSRLQAQWPDLRARMQAAWP